MSCKNIRDSLSPYLEGLVSAEEKRAIREHLDQCSQCRAALEDLKKTQALLNSMDEVEPPPWMAAKIMARVRDEAEEASRKGWRKFFYPFHIKIPLQAFATILVVVLAVQLYKTTEPRFDPMSGRMAAKAPVVSEDARQGVQQSAPILPEAPVAEKTLRSKAKPAEPAKESLPAPDPGRDAFQAGGADLTKQEMPNPAAEIPAGTGAGNDTVLKMAPAPAPSARMKAMPPSAPAAVMPEYPYAAAAQSRAKAKADMEMTAERSYRAEKKAMSRDFALKSMAPEKSQAPVEITLRTIDSANAGRQVEVFLNKMGAANVSRKAEDGRQIITAETNREGAVALVGKLNEMGKASPAPAQWPSGRFAIKIEITTE